MQELLQPAVALIAMLFEQFPDEVPFGLSVDEMTEYATDKVGRRLHSIEGARGKDVTEIDADATPMRLEDTFAEEDAAETGRRLAATG